MEISASKTTRELIKQLFGSQMEASRRLKFHERSVRYWCQFGAPPHVLRVLDRLRRRDITLPWARQLLRQKRGRRKLNGRKAPA